MTQQVLEELQKAEDILYHAIRSYSITEAADDKNYSDYVELSDIYDRLTDLTTKVTNKQIENEQQSK